MTIPGLLLAVLAQPESTPALATPEPPVPQTQAATDLPDPARIEAEIEATKTELRKCADGGNCSPRYVADLEAWLAELEAMLP